MIDKKLILFDFDGTLADTSPGILNCIDYTIQKLNLKTIPVEEKYTFIGPSMEESYQRVFGLKGPRLQKAVNYHKEYAMLKGYKEVQFYFGIQELLKKLKQDNKIVGVTTLKPELTAKKILQQFSIDQYFDIVKGTLPNIVKSKKDLIEDAIAQAKISKEKAVLIGDSQYDAIGAKRANISFIGVTYGFGFKNTMEVEAFNPLAICNNVQELIKIFTFEKI